MEPIVIIGYGGLAKEIAQYIADINEVKQKWEFIGYCGEISSIIGMRIGASSIVMEDNELLETGEHRAVVIGSGLSKVMAQIHEKFSANCNLYYPNIIHPSTYWRVTLLSIQAEPLKIVNRSMMKEMLRIRSLVNPAMGISEVEFSKLEINRFRQENLDARKSQKRAKDGEDT